MIKKGILVLVVAISFLLPSFVYAACQTTETCTMGLYSPSNVLLDSCVINIFPVGGTQCNQTTNVQCSLTTTCQERGTYRVESAFSCHIDGVVPTSLNILTCSYDDCANCCTSGTIYTWGLGGDYILQSCCGDDANEYVKNGVGAPLCCNSGTDCAADGQCLSLGASSGNNCCYTGSQVDSNRPACAEYSSGTTCYYNGVAQCNFLLGWQCNYASKVCGAGLECADTCGTEDCFWQSLGGYDWGTPADETPYGSPACSDSHDNDCADGADMTDPGCYQCTSGPCCDTMTHLYRPSNYVCNSTYQTQYVCQDSGCGSDVYVQYRERSCSGSSSTCAGTISSWGTPAVYDSCASTENCVTGISSCQYNASCEDECSPGICCDSSSHPYQALPLGTNCISEAVCFNASTLCEYWACDGAGNCNAYGNCATCLGRNLSECGIATGNCLTQVGADACAFTDDVTRCADCDDECSAIFMCDPVTTSACCYSYSECLAEVYDPNRQPGQEPSMESQCLCHALFQDPQCPE